jgi:hypothetical protein
MHSLDGLAVDGCNLVELPAQRQRHLAAQEPGRQEHGSLDAKTFEQAHDLLGRVPGERLDQDLFAAVVLALGRRAGLFSEQNETLLFFMLAVA